MKKIYLIRHAQSQSNAGQAVRPNHAINLTDVGKTQAQWWARWQDSLVINYKETPIKRPQ